VSDQAAVDSTAEEIGPEESPETQAEEIREEQEAMRQELVQTSPTQGDVMVPLDTEKLVSSFEEYQKLRGRLLVAEDYQSAGGNKRFVKKSGWRKIATAFGLNLEILRDQIERAEDGSPTRAAMWCRAVAPNGRFADGDGYCDVTESRFSGSSGNKSKLENDLRATATTRAMNRAISNLVGMGEVSAEEVGGSSSDSSGPKHGIPAPEDQAENMKQALDFLFNQCGVKDKTGLEIEGMIGKVEAEFDGYVPKSAAGALILLAVQVQAALAAQSTK
jgi:hypothetical protein